MLSLQSLFRLKCILQDCTCSAVSDPYTIPTFLNTIPRTLSPMSLALHPNTALTPTPYALTPSKLHPWWVNTSPYTVLTSSLCTPTVASLCPLIPYQCTMSLYSPVLSTHYGSNVKPVPNPKTSLIESIIWSLLHQSHNYSTSQTILLQTWMPCSFLHDVLLNITFTLLFNWREEQDLRKGFHFTNLDFFPVSSI